MVARKKSLVAKEFSQHRHRSFRLVIASFQIGPTAQRRAQLKHLETTLRTPPAHTHTGCGPTDKNKLRGASRRHHKRQTRGVCVYPSLAVSMPPCIRPARVGCLLKNLVANDFSQHRHSCITQPTASYNVRLNLKDTTSQACSGQTTCCCGSAGRKGSRQSEVKERGCCEAQRPGEF